MFISNCPRFVNDSRPQSENHCSNHRVKADLQSTRELLFLSGKSAKYHAKYFNSILWYLTDQSDRNSARFCTKLTSYFYTHRSNMAATGCNQWRQSNAVFCRFAGLMTKAFTLLGPYETKLINFKSLICNHRT